MKQDIIRSEISSTVRYFLRPVDLLRNYRRADLRPDLLAGLTIAVILLPQSMAYALIADLPPEMGLYTAVIGAIVGAIWGSSRQLQTGPTNAASLLVLSILLPVAASGSPEYILAAGLLTLLVGLFRLGMGLARLGILVNFVSDSVIIGFTAGAGLLIFFNQLRNLFGLAYPPAESLWSTWRMLIENIAYINWYSLGLGLATIFAVLIMRGINKRLPAAMLAILGAGFLTVVFDLQDLGVRVIGPLPKGLPPLSIPPIFDLELVSKLAIGALAVAAIGLIEAISIARSIASQTGQRLDSNQEFLGQGLANIATSFFSGYTCSGSFTRSAVNYQAGARTGFSNVFAGLMVLATMLAFGSWAAYIPLPALAGLVIVVSLQLIDRREIRRIWEGARGDRVIMTATFAATLLLPLQYAVLTGILMSLAYYLLKTSMPAMHRVLPDENFEILAPRPGEPECPQLSIVEILGDLYFGAVQHIESQLLDHLARYPGQRYLMLRMYSVENCDISGIHALENVLRNYRQSGGDVYISRCQEPVMKIMRSTGFIDRLGADHVLGRGQHAIHYLFHHVLDPAICIYECPVRAFKECQNLAKRLDLVGEGLHTEIPHIPIDTIAPQELWRELHAAHPPQVIDVREPREFARGHVPNAQLWSLPEILHSPEQLHREEVLVLVCQGGRRSMRAAVRLKEAGFTSIRVLQGGMSAWEAANLLEAIEEGGL